MALELVAHASEGIFFQGTKIHGAGIHLGGMFKKGSTIEVKPGYKKATELAPGSVYAVMPGVKYKMPDKP